MGAECLQWVDLPHLGLNGSRPQKVIPRTVALTFKGRLASGSCHSVRDVEALHRPQLSLADVSSKLGLGIRKLLADNRKAPHYFVRLRLRSNQPKQSRRRLVDSLTGLFCLIDDFCQRFEPEWKERLLADGRKKRRRPASLSLSELMALAVLFHQLRYRQFKSFYHSYALRFLRAEFPGLPNYHRCLELMPRCAVPLSALFDHLKGHCTGITILEASPLAVCDNLRIPRRRVFAKVAARGKSSTGWFYGLKLHAAVNHYGELLSIKVTPGNVDDRKSVASLCHGLFGRVYAYKGYVARWLVDLVRARQLEFITKVRKNMKPIQHTPFD